MKMSNNEEVKKMPDYLFEVSWEVCNKVGGIHTVIATKALTISKQLGDHYILIGPDVHREDVNLEFEEDPALLKEWKQVLFANHNIRVKTGRWKVKGKPLTILVEQGRCVEIPVGELPGRFDQRAVGLYRARAVRCGGRQGDRELRELFLFGDRPGGGSFP